MNLDNRHYCDEELIRFLREEDLEMEDGSIATISVTSAKQAEQMIFFGKSDNGQNYELRVYKVKPSDRYISHALDKCTTVVENDECATFLFNSFNDMKDFVQWIHYRHMEFVKRPKKIIIE